MSGGAIAVGIYLLIVAVMIVADHRAATRMDKARRELEEAQRVAEEALEELMQARDRMVRRNGAPVINLAAWKRDR